MNVDYMNKYELVMVAGQLGITNRHKMRVGALREAIKAKQAAMAEDATAITEPAPEPVPEPIVETPQPTETKAAPKETKFSWYWWVCEKLDWRNPIALILVTWFEVLLYGYFKNGMRALLPPEMAGPFALLLSLMSWAYVSGAIGNHRPRLRWATYFLIVAFRIYFEFYTIYGVLNKKAIEGAGEARALTEWSVLAGEARKANEARAELEGKAKDADERMDEQSPSGIGPNYKAAAADRTAARQAAEAAEAKWKAIEPLLTQPKGDPDDIYRAALELYAACGTDCTAPLRERYIDTEHEVSFLLPVEALASGNQNAWATLMIVFGLSTLAFATAINVEIPPNKRNEEG